MGRLDGKVAFITGAARGQGRSHAVRLAEEGADIIAVDILNDVETVEYPLARESDMEQTVKLVEGLDRRIIFEQADVRDLARLKEVAARGASEFGRIDIICANAGICTAAPTLTLSEESWQTTIDINLTGSWKTVAAAAPHIVEGGRGGSIVLTASIAGVIGYANEAHYTAAKHGVVGLMKVLAIELAPHNIRANAVLPSNVDTDMIHNPAMRALMTGNADSPREAMVPLLSGMHALNIPWVDARDISNAVLWLSSDEARYVTGTTQLIDGGATAPFKIPH